MKNKYKIILIICVIIGICSILVGSIAYYRIVVEGNIKGSTGNAVFVLKDENSNVWNNKEINLGKVNPGDSGEFTVTMDASGSTVDIYATLELDRGTLPTNLKFYTTSDHKSELHKYYSFLEKGGTSSETLTIYWYWNPYISDEEDSKFINIDNVEANIRVSAVQISEYAMMKNGYNGSYAFWSNTYMPYIRTITFGNDLSNLPGECTEENLCWDISYSASQNKKVYGYLINSGLTVSETNNSTTATTEKPLYNLYIVSTATIFSPNDCSKIFNSFKNLIQINFNNNFNTSKVTTMSMMFSDCSSLTSLDLSSFNTSKVTSLYQMFKGNANIKSITTNNFDTSNVRNMSYMFSYCSSLTSLDLSNFNTSNVRDMGFIFDYCSSLTSLDLSSFNTANVTSMRSMFSGCKSLTSIDLSSFNTSQVTDMSGMFSYCSALTNLDLSSFNTSQVTNMSGMFSYCSSLISLDLSNFNTSNVTSMSTMFSGCSTLRTLDLSGFNTSKVTSMLLMFSDCKKLQTQINIMNTGTTSYSNMFSNAASDPSAHIIIGYTTNTQSIAEGMRNTCTNATAKARIELKKID